jgi:hypothetical protein
MFRKFRISLICLAGLMWAAPIQAQPDPGDLFVGRSATNQLKIGPPGSGSYVPEDNITVLPVSETFSGWSDIEPGFDHIVADQPALDFFTLQSGCQIRLELIQSDPAFKAVTPTFEVIDMPGERALLGDQNLHTHVTWWIDSDDGGFDPLKVLWRATYQLVDTGATGYVASDPFTLSFANVDCDRGDCNADTFVDGRDVGAFVEVLLSPATHTAAQRCSADLNKDGYVSMSDVQPFVDALLAAS